MNTNIAKTQVRLPRKLFSEVKQVAKSKGVSFNSVAVQALNDCVINQKSCNSDEVQAALEIITNKVKCG